MIKIKKKSSRYTVETKMRHIIMLFFYYHLSVITFAISAGSGAVNDIHSPVTGWANSI